MVVPADETAPKLPAATLKKMVIQFENRAYNMAIIKCVANFCFSASSGQVPIGMSYSMHLTSTNPSVSRLSGSK